MWRFMGIQAKNRKEWVLQHVAGMHQKVTTVALYDTLGQDAMRFVVNQTQLSTIAVSIEYVQKLSQLKLDDQGMDEQKMTTLKNLIVFEDALTDKDKEIAEKAGITLYTMDQLIE
jgi:long-chain acyl-CoA synthetase